MKQRTLELFPLPLFPVFLSGSFSPIISTERFYSYSQQVKSSPSEQAPLVL